MLPETDPPFTPIDVGIDAQNVLKADIRLLKYCLNIPDGEQLRPLKREQMFIQLLERLHAEEAELICLTKDKRLKEKYKLTKDTIAEAYPDIHWGGRS